MERKEYPSDISREQFEKIRGMLERAKCRTAPRRKEWYDVFCAIRYLLKFRLAMIQALEGGMNQFLTPSRGVNQTCRGICLDAASRLRHGYRRNVP